MSWKLRKIIFGKDVNIDIDVRWLPIQEIYDFRLRHKWTKKEYSDRNVSKDFVRYALRFLPDGFFIIFSFDLHNELFVQYAKLNGNIVVDFPLWNGNSYYGEDKELISLLRSIQLTRKYWKNRVPKLKPYTFVNIREGKNKKEIRASFGKNYINAAKASLLIAEKIFNIKTPGVFRYESGKLIEAAQ